MQPATVLVSIGTRPEAVKLAPLVHELKRRDGVRVRVLATAQHRELLDQTLRFFGVEVDIDLDLMRENQGLADLTGRMISKVDAVLTEEKPDFVFAQGDTTTVMVTGLACYYRKIPMGHVEAGLRTGDKYGPFPEEVNRKLVGALADIHFAPTELARNNLLAEGVSADRVYVTGNTVVDALLWAENRLAHSPVGDPFLDEQLAVIPSAIRDATECKLLLVTGHRRESFGPDFEAICTALLQIVEQNKDVHLAYPVHLNPNVREPVYRILGGKDRIHLFEPPPYFGFVWLLSRSHLILTDSGGIQEEAPSLDKPVLVTRRVTERPEGVEAGCARLVGVDTDTIVSATEALLTDPAEYERMSSAINPYGDGTASAKTADALEEWLASNG